jgi:hypothetical protein
MKTMKKQIYLTIFLLNITCIAQSQIMENNCFDFFFGGKPESEMKMYGIGSLGFGEWGNNYNPKYLELPQSIIIKGGILYSMTGNTYEFLMNKSDDEIYKNNTRVLPSIDLFFKAEDWLFQIDYFYSTYSDATPIGGTFTFVFPNKSGSKYYRIISQDPQFQLMNQRLQFAISKRVTDDVSMGLGIIFNGTNQIIDFNTSADKWEYSTSMFDYPQFLASINCILDPVNIYFLCKTQRTELSSKASSFQINGDDIETNIPFVSYPGLVGYGIEYNIKENLSVSLEMAHHYCVEDIKRWIDQWRSLHVHQDMWNNEIILGIKYTPLNNVSLGVLYDSYLKYDRIGLADEIIYDTPLPQVESLKYCVVSASYDSKLFSVLLQYQYSFFKETEINNYYTHRNSNTLKGSLSIPIGLW